MSSEGVTLVAFMIAIPVAIAGALVLVGILRGSLTRSAIGAMLLGLGFVTGAVWQKATFINNHIDMCADDTSGYYLQYNRFDPYCEVVDWND